jgi:hypothetical protein
MTDFISQFQRRIHRERLADINSNSPVVPGKRKLPSPMQNRVAGIMEAQWGKEVAFIKGNKAHRTTLSTLFFFLSHQKKNKAGGLETTNKMVIVSRLLVAPRKSGDIANTAARHSSHAAVFAVSLAASASSRPVCIGTTP